MPRRLSIQGIPQAKAALRRIQANALDELRQALFVEANDIMNKSKAQVPVLTGVLRGSGTVFQPVIRGNKVTIELGYGGAASAYAVIQHENVAYVHPRGGKAKYLQDPLMAAIQGMEGRLGRSVNITSRGF